MVFPEAGLRFVDAEGNGGSGWQAVVIGGQSLFIHAVAGLVQHTEERGGEIRLVVAGGEPHIARAERGAERMGGGVDAAGLKSKPIAAAICELSRLLGFDGVWALWQGGGAGGGFFDGFRGGLAERGFHGIEQGGDGGGGGAAFVAFEQGVVGFASVSPERGFFAGDV
jgi:hypothetical protein